MGFFRCVETTLDALDAHPDVLQHVREGKAQGLLIRGLFAPEPIARVVSHLEAGQPAFPWVRMGDQFEAYSLGRALDFASEDLSEYLGAVPDTARASDDLFSELGGLEARLDDVFARVSSGRPLEVPRFQDGRSYLGIAVHCLPRGGCIPPHCENEQATRGPYRHLNRLLDGVTLMSYFLTLAPAEREGALVVHDFRWEEVDATHFHGNRTSVEHALGDRASIRLDPQSGDLLVFDGGRYFHEVATVVGNRTRWTVGGLLGFSRDGRRIYRWA